MLFYHDDTVPFGAADSRVDTRQTATARGFDGGGGSQASSPASTLAQATYSSQSTAPQAPSSPRSSYPQRLLSSSHATHRT
jgi:hypothetical protein